MKKIVVYQVGGSIRDELLNVPSKDIDYAIEAPCYDDMRNFIIARGGEIFLETPQYFTIRAKMPGLTSGADFVLCRKDGSYSNGRHPDSVSVGTILDDLARRDFTMNAVAKNCETGEIIDPFNGREDIKQKIIRFVGKPYERLQEDRLRAFRAARFSITKGFELCDETIYAIHSLTPNQFDSVSTERIREEIMKMFKVDTYGSFNLLFNTFHVLGKVVLQRGIWFKPTTEGKK